MKKKENKPNVLFGIASILEAFKSFQIFSNKAECVTESIRYPIEDIDGLKKDAQALRSDWEKVLGPDLKGIDYAKQ